MRSRKHPILAQLIPTRRCNLSCTYCSEYDRVSNPVPIADLLRRVDRLADIGTTIITISGGEPLLHPELDRLIGHIRTRGAIATLITNGYLLTPERIHLLNRAGLHQLQISIDNVEPDEVSKKSLKVLDRKLVWLSEHAEFDVSINAVLGAGAPPRDALTIARRAAELGLGFTTGVIHDSSGQVQAIGEEARAVLDAISRLRKPIFSFVRYNRFQHNVALGRPNDWHCRAGSRYLYICEDGLVHWCSQQRGYPGIPLERYSRADLEREFHSVKTCAPYCTINCVHQTAILDCLRENPRQTILELLTPPDGVAGGAPLPASVRLLMWAFLGNSRRGWMSRAALRILGVE